MSYHWVSLGLAVSLVVAVVAHETTHAVVGWALADETSVDWRGLTTYCVYPESSQWRPVAVAVAPLATGVIAGLGYLLVNGLPSLSPWSAVGVAGWFIFTLGGGLDEYRLD